MSNYTQKLANMRSRRLGLDASAALSAAFDSASLHKSLTEAYETRGKTEAIKYALGAMQALDAKYTEVSIQEGDRVKNQLDAGLQTLGIPAYFEYQGSVPLDIHIRRTSDIDLLVLHGGFVTVDWTGCKASTYVTLSGTVLDEMVALRSRCESILDQKFPSAKVDKSGAKSICVSGGSLQRKIDVVPSHWHDSAAYQISREKHDREIRILDKFEKKLIANRPFLHMQKIQDKESLTNGGTKKVIRLLKNLKRDSSKDIKLSSYDIASIVWNLDSQALNKPYYLELSLVGEILAYLQYLEANSAQAKMIDVPDMSRKVFDSPDKFEGLRLLKAEVEELAADIAKELQPIYSYNRELIQKSLAEAYVF